MDYVNSGGNVAVSAGPLEISAGLMSFLGSFGVYVSEQYVLTDNLVYNAADKRTDRNDVLISPASISPWLARFIDWGDSMRPILAPKSSVQRHSQTSGYVAGALGAPRTSYAAVGGGSLSDMKKFIAGPMTNVATAVQTKANSRVFVLGSAEMCSEATFAAKVRMPGTKTKMPNGNKKFCNTAIMWAFQERGVLRSSEIGHASVATQAPKNLYSIKDDMVRLREGSHLKC